MFVAFVAWFRRAAERVQILVWLRSTLRKKSSFKTSASYVVGVDANRLVMSSAGKHVPRVGKTTGGKLWNAAESKIVDDLTFKQQRISTKVIKAAFKQAGIAQRHDDKVCFFCLNRHVRDNKSRYIRGSRVLEFAMSDHAQSSVGLSCLYKRSFFWVILT